VPKQITNWNEVLPGDIVSFRYKSIDKSKSIRTHTIMVLNNKFPKKLKSGKQEYYLNGLKLEASNINVFTDKEESWDFLKELGWVVAVDIPHKIYRVRIKSTYIGPYGVTKKLYERLKVSRVGRKARFRSYLYDEVKKNAVFIEPINLPPKRIQMLKEQKDAEIRGEVAWRRYLETRDIDEEDYED
jgi:hypothetical protein